MDDDANPQVKGILDDLVILELHVFLLCDAVLNGSQKLILQLWVVKALKKFEAKSS